MKIGSIVKYYLNGDETGELLTQTIDTLEELKQFQELLKDGSIEIFSVK